MPNDRIPAQNEAGLLRKHGFAGFSDCMTYAKNFGGRFPAPPLTVDAWNDLKRDFQILKKFLSSKRPRGKIKGPSMFWHHKRLWHIVKDREKEC
jgi:hypothetical protein